MGTEIKKRYEGLDQLRGILAFTVMIYHYLGWLDIKLPLVFQKPLDVLGLYAVGSFYALSGCALYIVYNKAQVNKQFLAEFFLKRSFRIIPLFWFITTASIVFVFLKGGDVSFLKAFVNYTLLFSWVSPGSYIATGSWSIGNEWAFYTLFPLLIWAVNKKKLWPLSIITVAFAFWYWFVKISPELSVSDQWKTYVEPMNQFPLFFGGFLVGKWVISPQWPNKINRMVFILATIFFVLFSYLGSTADSIYGWGRALLVLVSVIWCYSFGILENINKRISRILSWLGMISYTLYLAHPLVMGVVKKLFKEDGKINLILGLNQDVLNVVVLLGSIGLTLMVSYIIYIRLEKPSIELGRKVIASRSFKKIILDLDK